jgi:hypothetical protein
MALAPSNPQVLYASGLGVDGSLGCAFRSEDGGAHWVSLNEGLPANAALAVTALRDNPAQAMFGTNTGAWKFSAPLDHLFADGFE